MATPTALLFRPKKWKWQRRRLSFGNACGSHRHHHPCRKAHPKDCGGRVDVCVLVGFVGLGPMCGCVCLKMILERE